MYSPATGVMSEATFSFAALTRELKAPYTTQKQLMLEDMAKHTGYREGVLLNTMESGVYYPVVHYVNRSGSPHDDEACCTLDNGSVLFKGVYSVLKSFDVDDVDKLSPSVFILLGYKTIDNSFSDVLERSWKQWTGVRQIYLNLSQEFPIKRITFFQRTSPPKLDLFKYVVLVEITGITKDNKERLIDFVQRLRVDTMKGYVSVYQQINNVLLGVRTENHS